MISDKDPDIAVATAYIALLHTRSLHPIMGRDDSDWPTVATDDAVVVVCLQRGPQKRKT